MYPSVEALDRQDVGVQTDIASVPNRRRCGGCSRRIWMGSSIVIVIIAVLAAGFNKRAVQMITRTLFGGFGGFRINGRMFDHLGMDGVVLFKQHDRNHDGVLSIDEFEPLAHRLLTFDDSLKYNRSISKDDEMFTIETKFIPLQMETITKNLSINNPGNLDAFQGLKSWRAATKNWMNFGSGEFKAFFPEDCSFEDSVGSVYWLIHPLEISQKGPTLSSNRYLPPPLSTESEILIHRLLSMFHPLPFVYSRFSPQGSTAVVRALSDTNVDIVFRIHAEFQLNQPPFYPFWFTPAQFMGNLIITRDFRHLISFNMHVPNDKKLNVDMEWMVGPKTEFENMEVDIGYMPEMDLSSTRSSLPAFRDGTDMRDEYTPADGALLPDKIIKIAWVEEISMEEARKLLELEMYPFKQVTYYNFSAGLHEATQLDRPLHLILLWGSLDDQSC